MHSNATGDVAYPAGIVRDEGYAPYAAQGGEDDSLFDFDLREVSAALVRNRIWIALILALSLAAGVAITMLTVPRYTATSEVLIEQQAEQIIQGAELAPAAHFLDAQRFLNTQVEIIQSADMARRVVKAEGLVDEPGFFAAMGGQQPTEEAFQQMAVRPESLEALREEAALGLLLGSMTVELPADSRLVSISVNTRDPSWSARLANAVAENYIAANLARKYDSSAYAREYLAQQLAEARTELENSERELNQYSRVAGLVRMPSQSEEGEDQNLSITTSSLVQLNRAASEATAQRVVAENVWQSIANTPVMNIPQVLSNPAVQALIRQRSELESQLAQQRARYLDDHPNVQAAKAQVANVNREIDGLGQSIKRSIRLEYQAARDREADLKGRVSALTSDALDEQDRGVRFNVLQREAETKRDLYDTLLERYNALNATAGAASNNVSMVDEASVPRRASSPNLLLNLILAFAAGMGLAAIFVFLREYFDDTIRVPSDVENKLGLPLLGLIPASETGDIEEELADTKSPLSEAYATLLTNLRFSTTHGLPHVIAITSAQQAEGKSTSSFALAQDIAEFGKRVLLLDADMRRPTLHRQDTTGLADGLGSYLVGERSFDEVVRPSPTRNLDWMSALPTPPDPPILLNSGKMDELLETVRGRYDCVVIDCPPLLGLSDTAILATHSDAVLMVVDAQAGHRGSVKTALRRLRLINAPILGAILTKFDPRGAGSEYSYNYYRYEE